MRWWEDDDAWEEYIAEKEQLVLGVLQDDVVQYDPLERARVTSGGGGGGRGEVRPVVRDTYAMVCVGWGGVVVVDGMRVVGCM